MQQHPTKIRITISKGLFWLFGKQIYKDFAERLPIEGNEAILDFSCGLGGMAYFVSKRLKRGTVYCFDSSPQWIKACQKTLKRQSNYMVLMSTDYQDIEQTFDLIYCYYRFQDYSDQEVAQILNHLMRCLKPGGYIIFRESLKEVEKVNNIKLILYNNYFILRYSRINDLPLAGSAIECVYQK